MKKILVGIFFLSLLVSCTSTKISSFSDPNIKISEYKRILICGDIRDIEIRKTIEKDLVNEFTQNGKNVISSIDVISPLKEYSKTELNQIYLKNNIDCILSVSIINTVEGEEYIPQQTYINYTSTYVNGIPISVPLTTTTGGYSESYLKVDFEIKLTDVETGEIVFRATANSEGDDISDMGAISKSLSEKITEEYLLQQ